MICYKKHFQEGRFSLSTKSTCSYSLLNQTLVQEQCLTNFSQNLQVYSILQSIDYAEILKKEYNANKSQKNNWYLANQFEENSPYSLCLKSIISSSKQIQNLYCDYGFKTGGLTTKRIINVSYFDEIEVFLKETVIPELKLLQIQNLLADKYEIFKSKLAEGVENVQFSTFFSDYLTKVVSLNLDLHIYINYLYEVQDNVTDGNTNFNSSFFLKDVPLLELEPFINPTALAISYFLYKVQKVKRCNKNNLPRISFLNLDGFDHGYANFNSFGENTRALQYISLFDDEIDENYSTVDTFYQPPPLSEGKRSEVFRKDSLFIPLIRKKQLNDDGDQNQRYSFQVSSGKIRDVFRNYVIPLIQSFQPDIIIISHSLTWNHDKVNSPLSLNPKLFSEMTQQLSSISNSRVLFCPRFPKNLHKNLNSNELKSHSILNYHGDYSFDEKYYANSMSKYAFEDQSQIESCYQHMSNIFGAFVQVAKKQWNINTAKQTLSINHKRIIEKNNFNAEIRKYLKTIIEKYNPFLRLIVPEVIDEETLSELSNLLVKKNFQKNAQKSVIQKIQATLYSSLKDPFKELQNGSDALDYENLDQYFHPSKLQQLNLPILLEKFLLSSPYISSSIHILFSSFKDEKFVCNIERCQFQTTEGFLYFSEQTQYYVDYENKYVYLFNVPQANLVFKNFVFHFDGEYPQQNGGFLTTYSTLPDFPEKLNGEYQLLAEFSIAVHQKKIFIIYGKKINKENFFNYLVLRKEIPFELSEEIYFLDFGNNTQSYQGLEWKKLKIIPEKPESCYPDFSPQEKTFGRLYPATIIINKKNKNDKDPMLFIFGGVLVKKGQSNLCNLITRIVPTDPKQLGTCEWTMSMRKKEQNILNLRPLCNSMAIEVGKGKILLVGGTQNKYLIPMQNSPVQIYLFQQTSTDSQKSQKKSQEASWELTLQKGVQDVIFTNGALSSQNRNIFVSTNKSSSEDDLQRSQIESNSKQQDGSNRQLPSNDKKGGQKVQNIPIFFIALNSDKYENEKGFFKVNNNLTVFESNQNADRWQFKKNTNHSLNVANKSIPFQNQMEINVNFSPQNPLKTMNQAPQALNQEVSITQTQMSHFNSSNINENQNYFQSSAIFSQRSTSGILQKQKISYPSGLTNDISKMNSNTDNFLSKQETNNSNGASLNIQFEDNQQELVRRTAPVQNQLMHQQFGFQNNERRCMQPSPLLTLSEKSFTQSADQSSNQQTIQQFGFQGQSQQIGFQAQQANLRPITFNENSNFFSTKQENFMPNLMNKPNSSQNLAPIGNQNQFFQTQSLQQNPFLSQESRLQSTANQVNKPIQNPFGNSNFFSQQNGQMQFETPTPGMETQLLQSSQNQLPISSENSEEWCKKVKQIGQKLGILHVGIFHFYIKSKQEANIKIEGGTFRDDFKYINKDKLPDIQYQQKLFSSIFERHKLQTLPKQKQKQEMIFAAQVPNKGYFHNQLFLITLQNGEKETAFSIDIKIIKQSGGRQEDITPSPDEIKDIQISSCGTMYFLLHQEKNQWTVYQCNHSQEILASKCLRFKQYIKYRSKIKLYQLTKESRPVNNEQKDQIRKTLEEQQKEFEASHSTNGIKLLIDTDYLYLLSPKITKNMTIEEKIKFFEYLSAKNSSALATHRVESSHLFFPYKVNQEFIQLVPQSVDWFTQYDEHDVKVAQSTTEIAIILNKFFICEQSNQETVYELKYKLIPKVSISKSDMQLKESEKVYSYRFTVNRNLSRISTIHYLQNTHQGEKMNLYVLLIQEDNSLSDSSLAISFILPNFTSQIETNHSIKITSEGLRPFSKFMFFQLPKPTAFQFFCYDHSSKSCTNLLASNNQ